MSLILMLLRVVKVLLKAEGQTDQGISETILPQLCHIPASSPCMHTMTAISLLIQKPSPQALPAIGSFITAPICLLGSLGSRVMAGSGGAGTAVLALP